MRKLFVSPKPQTPGFKLTPLAIMLTGLCLGIQSSSSLASDEEEVMVTASPLAQSSDKINQAVTALSGAQLQERAAATLGETLNGLLGVSSSSFGPGVGLPVIRGQSDNRVKVMQDSVGTMDASAASPDHAVTAEPLLATRIEVLRGPAALRYGSGAIGGVVNVLDNRVPDKLPDNIEGGVELRYGSVNDETAAVATATGSIGNIAWHLDGVTRSNNNLSIPGSAATQPDIPAQNTQGYIDNTDAESHSNTLGLSYIGDSGFIGLAVNKMKNNYGVPPDVNESDPEHARIDMQQTRYDLKGELDTPLTGIDKVTLRLGHNNYEHVEIADGQPGTRFTNNAWEGRIEAIHSQIANWQGALGVQLASRTFAALGEEAFIPKSDIRNQGIFFVEQNHQGPWIFELGARAEQQRITPDTSNQTIEHNSANFSGSVVWHFTGHQRLSLSIAQSQRAPSVEELLSNGPHDATGAYLIGNPDLRDETSNNIEFGYHWHSQALQAAINVYHNQIDHFIYARATGAEEDGLSQYIYTQSGATYKGAEAEATIPLDDNWKLRVFSDLVNARLEDNSYVPRIPPMRYGANLKFAQNAWSASLDVTHALAQNHPGEHETPSAAYTRVDASINYQLDQNDYRYLIFLKGTNLLNSDIRNATSFLRDIAPEAGRGVQVGVRVNF